MIRLPQPAFNRSMRRSLWIRATLISFFVILLVAVLFRAPLLRFAVRANPPDVAAVARAYPNFTAQQRSAIFRQYQSTLHPLGRNLTFQGLISRFARFLAVSGTSVPPAANFLGNLTAVAVNEADAMVLAQQPNCSLNLDDWSYTLNPTALTFSYTIASSTPNEQLALHTAAGLTTTPGTFPAGCGNTNVGVTSHKIVFAGVTTSNVRVYAGHFFDAIAGADQIFVVTANSADTFQKTTMLSDPNSVIDLATADLNGDGNGDLVSIDDPLNSSASAIVNIFLGNADGSFAAPTQITLQGALVSSAVVDDFNGDGKKDIIVTTHTFPGSGTTQEFINFLAGNGNGTFQPVQSVMVSPPSGFAQGSNDPYFGIISADLRGSGHKDLITSSGIILFGNGNGTFSQSATLAFPAPDASSELGPNVVAADFNKDGKLDLATDDGQSIQVFLGNGAGVFTPKAGYSTIGNTGYLTAQDIDGDGNIDLYTGAGNNGSIGGDSFDNNLGYALMGNGDGTFRGAPSERFSYTGTNLASLRNNGTMDAVGLNVNGINISFESYLGDGKGNFTAGSTVVVSPITLGGSQFNLNTGINSYALGDLNGDGFPDLVYLCTNFFGPGFVPGIFVATGKGDGSFNAPVFIPAPAFVPSPDIDVNPTISGIHLADFNHDGKLDVIYTYDTNSFNLNTNFFGLAVQLGNGNGTFQSTATLTQLFTGANAPNPGAFQIGLVGNVNKDSFPDVLLLSGLSGNSQSFTLQILLGTGTGAFQTPTTVAGVTPGNIFTGQWFPLFLADMNNDGTPDLVDLQPDQSTGDQQIAIAIGNGDGTFKTPSTVTYASQSLGGSSLAVADFNGDGNLDVATTSFLGTSGSGIAFGNGNGTLQTSGTVSNLGPAQVFYVVGFGASTALDFNGDGKPDILIGSVLLLNGGASTTVTPAATSTALASSTNPSTPGQQVTFTATVTSTTAGTPTGTVTLKDGATQIGTGTLNAQAKATFQTSSLSTASHSITAQYAGDSNFAASNSSPALVQVVQAAASPDFSISLQTTTLTLPAGQSGGITVTVTPLNGSTQTVSFTCNNLPTQATCASSPITLNGATAQNTTVTLLTTARSVVPLARRGPTAPASPKPVLPAAIALAAIAMLAWLAAGARRPQIRASMACATFVLAGMLLMSCSGGGSSNSNNGGGGGTTTGTPAGNYAVSVTGTAGSTTHTTNSTVALTVN